MKWLVIRLAEPTSQPASGKTRVWEVIAKKGGVHLGRIRWYGPWRSYALFPRPETVFERTCLRNIKAFIAEQMAERRRQRAA